MYKILLDLKRNALKFSSQLVDNLQGKEFGFDGKTLIHPSTIEITNKVFAPSEQEVEDAKNIISLFHEAEQSGK